MKVAKLFVVLSVSVVAVLALILVWVHKLGYRSAPNTAVDITRVALSPMFLLEFVAILAFAGWVYWRWAAH